MGKIEIDHTGANAGITLSSDGTDLLLDGTAIGGGGAALELYAENPVTPTAPSATGDNAVAVGSNAVASGTESIALGDSSVSSSSQSTALGSRAIASGFESIAIGQSRAGSSGSTAIGIDNNSTSYGPLGTASTAIGALNKATGVGSIALGRTNSADGSGTLVFGQDSTASQAYSVAGGSQALADIIGKSAHSAGRFSSQGDAQRGAFVLRSDTTDATAEALTSNNSTAGTTNQLGLPNNSAYAFSGTIVAREQASAGTDCAAWEIKGLIRREGSAGTTVLVNSATTVLDNTPAWGMALTADTTNGGLAVTVTGAAATNIRWVATINTSEVTY
jgi:hypothetical protein